uniref:Bacterial Pleckstrin homology domain-containing protein n=1 Tax=Alexandrium andersonii TaxID=327968 RepID=A0A7S2AKL3_9DINO|mmetsp:Transcript_1419/g.3158  ORF Transcript_1419/g.3158 Transcript_1419/m.3158 type:complete len:388 (+) Transcript_1419:2-1165(+)
MTGPRPPPPPPLPQKEDEPPPPPPCPTVEGWKECLSLVTFDLAAGYADVLGLQELLAAMVLGSPMPAAWDHWSLLQQNGTASGQSKGQQGAQGPMADLYHWMDSNAAQVYPQRVESLFKSSRILQRDETVKLAFRLGGDYHVWTSKRFLFVDRKGWADMGRKTLYRSIPYTAIKGFEVTSAGAWDWDSELAFYTDMPWLKHYKQDLRSGQVNLRSILQVLGEELMEPPETAPGALLEGAGPWYDFRGWLHGYAYELDPVAANKEFHEDKPLLLPGEEVRFACKVGRDTTLLTQMRALRVDVQGFTGTRVNYKSIPYRSMGSFFVRTAGIASIDAEMQLFTPAPAMPVLQQSFRYDLVDLFGVSKVLTDGLAEDFGPDIEMPIYPPMY